MKKRRRKNKNTPTIPKTMTFEKEERKLKNRFQTGQVSELARFFVGLAFAVVHTVQGTDARLTQEKHNEKVMRKIFEPFVKLKKLSPYMAKRKSRKEKSYEHLR